MSRSALLIFGFWLIVTAQASAQAVNNTYPAGNAQNSKPGDSALYEVLSRIEQLQSEVQQLRGVVEEQTQTISDLERKQKNMYADLDGRVQALTSATPQTAAPGQVPVTQQANVQPATAPTGVPAATSATVAPGAAQVSAPQTPAPVNATNGAIIAPVASKGNEKERFQVAYDTLRNGHNEQAAKMFETLLSDFPAGELADSSQYWLGEAYKLNREFDKARAAFSKLVSQYPTSSKVPDALLKIGYIEADLQNNIKARDYLTRVVNSYPGTTAANLAAKRLAQMSQ
jgi:tol-pal system protein YbgF